MLAGLAALRLYAAARFGSNSNNTSWVPGIHLAIAQVYPAHSWKITLRVEAVSSFF
jgi:hypothetical protein